MRAYVFLLFVHVMAVVVWVGGMFLMHFAVRPSAVELLPPPQRLPLLAAVLTRFFRWVVAATVLVLASGVAMIVGYGMTPGAGGDALQIALDGLRASHASVHAMFFVGTVMIGIFAWIRWVPYPRLLTAVAAQQWPVAAQHMDQIRQLVATNLVLGIATIGVATIGRAVL